jgi:hypothetical protein
LICYSISVSAQSPYNYSFQFYNSSHGLPSPEIICLAKDSKGFLWLGTSAGLSRYDGYNFQNHPYTKENEIIGYVSVIKADAHNRLWIGSGAGLFCYVNNEIIKVSATTTLPQGVNDIFADEKTIWLATENGPAKFDLKEVDFTGTQKIVLADHLFSEWRPKNDSIDERRTVLISKAPDNAIYFAQPKKLFRLLNNQLELIHTTTGIIDKIYSLFPISKSKIYFDAASTEINRFENGVNTVIPFKEFYKPGENATLPGQWYVGTRGAFYFHPQSGTASSLIKFNDKYVVWASAALPDNGFIWIASHDGLIKAKPSVFTDITDGT